MEHTNNAAGPSQLNEIIVNDQRRPPPMGFFFIYFSLILSFSVCLSVLSVSGSPFIRVHSMCRYMDPLNGNNTFVDILYSVCFFYFIDILSCIFFGLLYIISPFINIF